MADSTIQLAAPRGFLARLVKARESSPGAGGRSGTGYTSVLSFTQSDAAESGPENDLAAEHAGGGLFVARGTGLMPRDPVAHPKLKPRLEGAARPIFQACEEAAQTPVSGHGVAVAKKKMEVDIAAFVEAVSSAYPEQREPAVRPVLRPRPAGAARPFVFLPGAAEEPAGAGRPTLVAPLSELADGLPPQPAPRVWDPRASGSHTGFDPRTNTTAKTSEDKQAMLHTPVLDPKTLEAAHKERELKAFHEFLDRMESGPLEALDRPLAELDAKSDERRQYAAQDAQPYDPILEEAARAAAAKVLAAREAPPVPAEDRHIVEAVIEPLEPVANPRLPLSPAEVLAGGVPHRLSPSQRAHLKRPATVRDRHGRIAPVTYSLNPRTDT